MHYKKLFNNRFIGSWDLEGHESVTMTIGRVEVEDVQNVNGQAEKCPVLYFANSKTGKGMILNKTNAKAIANQHGPDVSKWAGKKVEIAVERVNAFGQAVDALRIVQSSSRRQRQAASVLSAPVAATTLETATDVPE